MNAADVSTPRSRANQAQGRFGLVARYLSGVAKERRERAWMAHVPDGPTEARDAVATTLSSRASRAKRRSSAEASMSARWWFRNTL